MSDESRWVPGGQQPRSRRTQEAFIGAAHELFATQGVNATSVHDIAARAERSVGSLYHHFNDKETLVDAVVSKITVEVETGLEAGLDPERWAEKGIREIASGYLTDALTLDRLQPGYKRIVNEVSLTDATTRERHLAMQQRVHSGLTELILDRSDSIGHREPAVAARLVADQLAAMLRTRLDPDFNPTSLREHDDATFVEEVVDSICSYLQLREN